MGFNRATVTGGCGFIGSHLVDLLTNEGCVVDVIDNLSTNAIDIPQSRPGVKYERSDVRFAGIRHTTDVVFHLASPVGPVGVLANAGKIGHIIPEMTYKLAFLCTMEQIPLVFVSTSEIYGATGTAYHAEDSAKVFNGYSARAEYAAAKMLSEIMIVNTPRLKYQIIRPFNVAGPRQQPDGGFVLPRFVIAALTGQPVTVYNQGAARRAFTHVDDIVRGIYSAALAGESNIWNLGNPNNEMSIIALAKRVIELSGSSSEIVFIDPNRLHGGLFREAMDKVPVIDKATKMMGWKPKKTVDDTIADVIDYYRDKIYGGYEYDILQGKDLDLCRLRP